MYIARPVISIFSSPWLFAVLSLAAQPLELVPRIECRVLWIAFNNFGGSTWTQLYYVLGVVHSPRVDVSSLMLCITSLSVSYTGSRKSGCTCDTLASNLLSLWNACLLTAMWCFL